MQMWVGNMKKWKIVSFYAGTTEIAEIQRLSDKQIFRVGEKVRIKNQDEFINNYWRIDKFTIFDYGDENLQVHFNFSIVRTTWHNLDNLIKIYTIEHFL